MGIGVPVDCEVLTDQVSLMVVKYIFNRIQTFEASDTALST